jgi:hypothetical protein
MRALRRRLYFPGPNNRFIPQHHGAAAGSRSNHCGLLTQIQLVPPRTRVVGAAFLFVSVRAAPCALALAQRMHWLIPR